MPPVNATISKYCFCVHLSNGWLWALCAFHARAQKHPDGVGHVVLRHVAVAHQVAGRAIAALMQRTRRREQFLHHRVVGEVARDGRLEPVHVGLARRALGEAAARAQQVGPPIEHVALVAARVEQAIDEAPCLVGSAVLPVGGDFRRGRNAAGDARYVRRKNADSSARPFGLRPSRAAPPRSAHRSSPPLS